MGFESAINERGFFLRTADFRCFTCSILNFFLNRPSHLIAIGHPTKHILSSASELTAQKTQYHLLT